MTIINASPDRTIQVGYEGEDRVTVLRFRYSADWLENGEGIFIFVCGDTASLRHTMRSCLLLT